MADKTIPELQLKSSVVGDENVPVDNGIQTYRTTPSQWYDYMRSRFIFGADELSNLTLTTAVGSSALTIAVKTKAGADPSSSDPVRVGFRSATLTSGVFVSRTIAGSLSLVVSSGSTLGQVDGQPSRIWVYLIDNAGTLELAVSHRLFGEDVLVSTTAEGGAGAADSATVMYSASARSSVACRLIGYIDNTQTTAGTWASAGSKIQLITMPKRNSITVQKFTSGSGTYVKPAGCTKIRVRAIGGGGAGAGSCTTAGNNAGNGGDGTDTTFGSSLITASKGTGGLKGGGSAGGGGGTINSPAEQIELSNGGNSQGAVNNASTTGMQGGHGGASRLGGNGGGNLNGAGNSGRPNTGGGGGGGGIGGGAGTAQTGPGGGAGGYAEALIDNPAATYAYVVGPGGTGGTAGTSGFAGGDGGSGVIIVEEFYD